MGASKRETAASNLTESTAVHPYGQSLDILRGGPVGLKFAKNLRLKHEVKLEFLEERGFQTKKPSMGRVWIFFWNNT